MDAGQLINLPPVNGTRSRLYLWFFKSLMPQSHREAW